MDNEIVFGINDILEKDEEVVWTGKPKIGPFVFSKIKELIFFAIIWIIFDGAAIVSMICTDAFSQMPSSVCIMIVVFFAVHLLPVWIFIAKVIKANSSCKSVEYFLTTKRVIIKTSSTGLEYSSFSYNDITDCQLSYKGINKMSKCGDILFNTVQGQFEFLSITNCQAEFVKIREIVKKEKTNE